MITHEYVQKIFEGPSRGDMASFWPHVEPNVDWIVKGKGWLQVTKRTFLNIAKQIK